jgi:peptide-methionine (S)-S-oxide reductase
MRLSLLIATTFSLSVGCSASAAPAHPVPAPALDDPRATGPSVRTAVFAGGCFWCVEAVFEAVEGVVSAESGYAGGTAETAKYDVVSSGDTRHAEAVRVTYDASKVTYGQLLQILFLTSDPTTKDRQGPDVGPQYRFAVFPGDEAQQRVLTAYVAQLGAARVFESPIVASVEPLTAFYPAEAYHQDFVRRNPGHPYVRAWSVPKLKKLLAALPERVKGSSSSPSSPSSPAR